MYSRWRRNTVLSIMSVVVAIPLGVSGKTFVDVDKEGWSHEPIQQVLELGGYKGLLKEESDFFEPKKAITRAEYITMITNIENLSEEELILSFEDFLLKPNESITRQEASVILGRYLDLQTDEKINFVDAKDIADEAKPYINGLVEKKIITGYTDGTFRPNDNMTREEATVLLLRSLKDKEENVLNYEGNLYEVNTYAGAGIRGYQDGGMRDAAFANPTGITLDQKGNIIIVDTYNNLIRQVSEENVSTLAGKATERDVYNNVKEGIFKEPSFAAALEDGSMIVSDTRHNEIVKIKGDEVIKLTTTANLFNHPTGIVVDQENHIYVADTLNHCIRKIDQSGQVTLVAGTVGEAGYKDGIAGESYFNEPIGIAMSEGGILYVADSGNQRIRQIKDGQVSTLAGEGTTLIEETGYIEGGHVDGVKAKFNFPTGIEITSDGILYIADTLNHAIRKLDTQTREVTTLAGGKEVGYKDAVGMEAQFNKPTDVVIKEDKLYIVDQLNNRIRVITLK